MPTQAPNGSADFNSWNFTNIEQNINQQTDEARSIISKLPEILDRGEELTSYEPASELTLVWLGQYLENVDRLWGLIGQLESHAYCLYSIETGNPERVRRLNTLEEMTVPLQGYLSRFRPMLNALLSGRDLSTDRDGVEALAKSPGAPRIIGDLTYYLELELQAASFQMSPELEDLASDLQRSAGDAWKRLQSGMSSSMSAVWNPVTGERKTLVELRNLAYDPKRHIRKKAYALELKLCEQHKVAFAASLNGVKGNSLTLYQRRGYQDYLEPSIQSSRISRKTLDSLISAMEEALPMFRRYLNAKAAHLGLPKLGFFDIFAPVGKGETRFSFPQAQKYIEQQFGSFSSDLGNFAKMAFDGNWIDAQPRPGKVGGAYMTDFPLSEESRILANFDGSFSAVSTLAHELGHGYHSYKLEGFRYINRDYPMTLAETASTFCEVIIYNAAIDAASEEEKISLIEGLLMENTQVIVDILSRFYFERSLFEGRKTGELSPEQLCDLMLDAQKNTYGDALDKQLLQPYMWAVKGHYYTVDLAFYNYPYAFGQLFALGLYAQFQKDRQGFPKVYEQILKNTGTMSAVDVCAKAGFDIETPKFWRDGLSMLLPYVETFENSIPAGQGNTL